jgi:hypothetical protein
LPPGSDTAREGNMKKLGVAIVLAGVLLAGGVRADDTLCTVQTLYRDCTAASEDPRQLYCLGVMAGVSATLDINGRGMDDGR